MKEISTTKLNTSFIRNIFLYLYVNPLKDFITKLSRNH